MVSCLSYQKESIHFISAIITYRIDIVLLEILEDKHIQLHFLYIDHRENMDAMYTSL